MPGRQYTADEQAKALAAVDAVGGNVSRAADQLGIPEQTLREWSLGRYLRPGTETLREQYRGELATALDDVAWKLLEAIPEKISEASLAQTATAMGIAIDKARLLRGEATVVTEDVTEAGDTLKRKLDELASRAGAAVVPGGPVRN